ncbi:nuclear pore complex protein NUP214 isoform X2 [Nymphaea colorata]|uniref:nuclear pore complex protein NUP214 isoform X2 n=1 Tax=Nymphaea colorata TaxID=210225 RepID=UPI00129E9071|nr:nuclear pore complex protein NUP214 isoform X2 [Nymphaea colorata]
MAVAKGGSGKLVELEEKEGVRELSDDYMVRTIGMPVPLLRSKAAFDEDDPPAQGLAISERLGLMFVAHHRGFFMANTKDVLSLAKDMKESNKFSSIQDLSIVDISLAGIPFLQLSLDSSILAACWGGELQFFSTDSLVKKVKEPFMSRSFDAPNHVKDLRWDKSGKNAYVALSSDGVLYHGGLRTQHTDIAENVEAVDWSHKGDLIAIAQMSSVCILSSDFKERFRMPLPPHPHGDDATTCKIEVDSIKWVRHGSIVIGCNQLSEDGIGGGYLVRVITSNDRDLSEVSHNVIVTFDSFFLSYNETLLPFGRGPLLFLNYLERWELAITANRKSIDDHIVFLGWFEDQKLKEPKVIEFLQDKWMPRIQMRANGDENLLVGFCVDLNVDDGKFEIEVDGGGRIQLSYCIMLCLTVDGMLTLFRVAKRSAPVTVPLIPNNSTFGIEEHNITFSGVQHELNTAVSRPTKHTVKDAGVDDKPLRSDVGPVSTSSSTGCEIIVEQSATVQSHDLQKSVIQITEESGSSHLQVEKSGERTDTVAKPAVQYSAVEIAYKTSPQVPMLGGLHLHVDKSPARTNSAVKSEVQSSAVESANRKSPQVTGPGVFMNKDFQKPFVSVKGTVDMGSSVIQNISLTTDRSSSQNLQMVKEQEDSFVGQRGKGFTVKSSSTGLYQSESVASPHGYPSLSQKGFLVPLHQEVLPKQDIKFNSLSPVAMESDDFSRAFENVREMAKELDCLLFSIEAEGCYMDAYPVIQKDCILAIEGSIRSLSKRCRDWKSITNGHLQDIQNLQNKAMQAIAKEVHMKSIVRQAKNSKYWDLWDCQKLRPEFEVKRRRLFKAKQDLIKQLVELERHFNVLELNKFGGEDIKFRVKGFQNSMELLRRGHELRSLYSTMNSQLAASTHLSECLSKHMAALNIAPSTVKRHETTKELFESIGLAYDDDAFQSPHSSGADSAVHLSKKPLISSSFGTHKEEKLNIFQNLEPETARRRRDSVDQHLVRFDPPKTIVKRILKEEFPVVTVDKFSLEKNKGVFNSEAGLVGSSDKDSAVSVALPSTNSHLHDQYPASKDNCFEAKKWSSKMPLHFSFNESKSTYEAPSNLASDSPGTSVLRANILPSTFSVPLSTLHSANIEGSITYHGKSSAVPSAKGAVNSTGQAYFAAKTGASAHIFNSKLSEQSRIMQVPSEVIEQGKAAAHASLQYAGFSGEKLEDDNHKYEAGLEHSLPVSKSKCISSKYPSLLPAGPLMEALQSTHSTGSAQATKTLSTGTSILPKSTSSSVPTSPVSTLLVPSPVSAFSPLGTTSSLSKPLYVHSFSSTTTVGLCEATRQMSADTERVQSSEVLLMATVSEPTLAPPILSSFQALASTGSASAFSSSAETSISSLLPPSNPLFSVSPSSSSATSAPILSSGASSSAILAPASSPVYVDLDHPKGSLSLHTVGLADGRATHGLHETVRTSDVSKSSPQKPDEGTIVSKADFLPTPATISIAGVSTGFSLGSSSNLFGSSSSISLSSQQTTVSTLVAENMDTTTVQEDEMEEELSDSTTTLNLGSLDGFGLGSTISNAPKSNIFGGSFSVSTQANTGISMSSPNGELFKPASFTLPAQLSKPSGSNLFSGAFGGMKNAMPVNNSFGQPAQIGGGQQSLGSVLGSFGQSRQFGVGLPGAGLASPNAFGGGFAGAATSGGFSAAASGGGGFAGAATGGGFAGAGASTGGFSGFSSKPGGSASSGSNLAPSPLSDRFTQIRK